MLLLRPEAAVSKGQQLLVTLESQLPQEVPLELESKPTSSAALQEQRMPLF